ncbi:response regulator transcription factor [SAR92 clade bacterium H455]|uniref:Response regulator transcription factor n=1 Tax=SAR92 clade bacterium H455 TaxID=2974818 RepID=A0ABY5TMM7_9GAMM|nr:response regulator transcription factor [SAR92 clade bacterium H455]
MNYLLVDDDPAFSAVLARVLQRRGEQSSTASNGEQAIAQLHCEKIDRVVLDLKLEQESGLAILQQLLENQPSLEVVILTGYSSISTAVEAIKLGAVNYLCKPAGMEEIIAAFEVRAGGATEVPLEDSPPSINRLEWEHIQKVLKHHEGNISATAKALGMHRRTLQRKLQKRPVKN